MLSDTPLQVTKHTHMSQGDILNLINGIKLIATNLYNGKHCHIALRMIVLFLILLPSF